MDIQNIPFLIDASSCETIQGKLVVSLSNAAPCRRSVELQVALSCISVNKCQQIL